MSLSGSGCRLPWGMFGIRGLGLFKESLPSNRQVSKKLILFSTGDLQGVFRGIF